MVGREEGHGGPNQTLVVQEVWLMDIPSVFGGLAVVAVIVGVLALARWTGSTPDVTDGQHRRAASEVNGFRDPTPTVPGWYYDPEGRFSHQAYWDGENWTGAIRLPHQVPTEKKPHRLRIVGWSALGMGAASSVFGFFLMVAGGTGTASGLNSFTMGGAWLFLVGLVLVGGTLVTAAIVAVVQRFRSTTD